MHKRIFNSVGSNYTLGFAFKALFVAGGEKKNNELIRYLNARYGGTTTLFYKGRNAIEYALRSSGVPYGSKVVICAYTCAVVPTAVRNAGYVPVYADISESSLDFSFETFKKLCDADSDIRAVIVQNTLGFTNSIQEIEALCHERGIILIEDLAHSAGASYPDGREVGTVGDYTILSFSQDKIVDAISGGALITRTQKALPVGIQWKKVPFRAQLRDRFYPIFTYKIRKTYSIGIGKALHYVLRKARMLSQPLYSLDATYFEILPGWYAALALYRLHNLSGEVARRRMCTHEYLEFLPSELHSTVTYESIERATCLRVPVLMDDRESLIFDFQRNGIYISDIWYDVPVSPKKYWDRFEKENRAPNACVVAAHMINFPTHMTMRSRDVERVAEELRTWQK